MTQKGRVMQAMALAAAVAAFTFLVYVTFHGGI